MRSSLVKVAYFIGLAFATAALGGKAKFSCACLIENLGGGACEESVYDAILKYRNPTFLQKEQDAALKKNLIKRGAHCGKLGGYACLKKVSGQNVERLLDDYSVEEAIQNPDLAYLWKKLDRLFQVQFVHNSHHLETNRPGAILSGKRLEAIGLSEAGQTGAFNDSLLGGADNIYFFAYPILSARKPKLEGDDNIYGAYTAIPQDEYAARWGWISPFVMYPFEFSDVMFTAFGHRMKWGGHQPTTTSMKRALPEMHKLDFTVPDFIKLGKALALRRLQRVQEEDPKRFKQILSHAKNPVRDNNAFLNEAHNFMYEFGPDKALGMDFEFKIPVAVPQEVLTIR